MAQSKKNRKHVLTLHVKRFTLRAHSMKTKRNERLKAALIGLLIATAIIALGLAEAALGLTPNH